ncbi:BTAD domain-containing putative transcriptional regulator [Microbacterium sp.]|uniref:nSTAND1 domain-containing NTPase n=1 Tax=Microbacterium sp. TaxID=51671 RepID=UPI003C771E4E
MLIRVLGPIEVQGAVVRPREALVLGALVVRRGNGISMEELASLVWPTAQPATWYHQLHSAVSRLRAVLPDGAVHTDGATYRLHLAPGTIDADLLDDAAARVLRHVASGEPGRAVSLGAEAASLWHGDPIPALAGWSERDAFASRIGERLLVIQEETLLARAGSAPATVAVTDLETAVDRDPYNERMWVALVHRHLADRRTDRALGTLRRASGVFQRDLGLDLPGALVELQTAVLRGDGLPEPPALLKEQCPYLGLEAYDESESALFFGRDGLADQVIEELLSSSVHVIVGASGIGKTSLIRAGILPRLRSRGRDATLTGAPEFSLPAHPVDILIIDQIEELLDAGAGQSADALMDGLREHAHVLLAVRSASLDDLLQVPGMSDRIGGSVSVIGPMARDEMAQAIEGPAVASGLRLEPGLTPLILRDLDDASGALPHLSHALQETWVRREGDTLTVLGYESVGGISGAVSRTAERLYESLDSAAREACRAVMGRLVHAAAEGTVVRRHPRMDAVALDTASRTVIDRFAAARLLVLDGAHVSLAHEALARAWPRLHGWLVDDAAWLRTLAMLEDAAAHWEDGGRSDDDLWRGARVASVDPDSTPTFLTASEAEFLARSRDREDHERRAAHEAWERERRTNVRLRTSLVAVAVLLVATVSAGVLSGINATRAAEQAESEQVARLLATSLALRESDRDVAALLAAEMHRRWPDDPRSRAALMGSMTSAGGYLGRHYVGGDEIAAAPVTAGGAIALVGGTELVRVSGEGALDPTGISLPTPGGEIAVSPEGNLAVRRGGSAEAARVDIVDLAAGEIETIPIDSRLTDVTATENSVWALSATDLPVRIWPSEVSAEVTPASEQD